MVGPSNPPNWWTSFQLGFDEAELGFLRRSVGFVWSDGFTGSLLTLISSERGRDVGIEFFRVTHLYRGNVFVYHFEVDHVQFGASVPEPGELTVIRANCLVLLGGTNRRRRCGMSTARNSENECTGRNDVC